MKKYIIAISIVIFLAAVYYQNRPMAISRQSATYYTGGSVTSTSFTHSAFNPGYGGTEKSRMVVIPLYAFPNSGVLAIVSSVTYGGVPMQVTTGYTIGNFASMHIWYIINPPTGAQDIVFTTINSTNWSMQYAVLAYESDTDTGLRIGNIDRSEVSSGTSLSTLFNTTASKAWMVGLTSSPIQNQTLTTGTFLVGDANPGKFEVVDSNAEITAGSSTGVAVTVGSATTIRQAVITIIPIRRGIFWFLD